ncbi:sensor histidine kinase [Amycolatopsis magusensis]|uniref:histidine kinase n=1 Tax=Amycolatopsis magusensis TaxID=882444 RepID=A0ABS4PJR4_9PSEU|nr:sensor histidine kinase [Amycolatopsis magusensis]MBP2179635.1 signal transduction histidine kinase [Amycolatopsis magusensis]
MVTGSRTCRPGWADLVLTGLVLVFVVGFTSAASRWQSEGESAAEPFRPLDALGYGWLVAAVLPLLLARRFPIVVFGLCSALAVTYYWSDYPGGPISVTSAIALFVLTVVRGVLPGAIAGGGLLVTLYVAHVVSTGNPVPTPASGALAGAAVAMVGIGAAIRARRAATRAAQDQAREHEQRLAEQERLRIAREVHDVVAHSLAMINVQAGVAVHVADRRPEQAKEALLNIKEASASALVDLRATLAVLRSGQERGPVQGLAQMDELLEHARAAGLTVRVHGRPGDLPAPTDGAAYRILQESLTNVVRHANQPSIVDIHFGRPGGRLELRVRDDGMGATPPRLGNGLRGMRERADALGGSIEAGPVDGGGFEVRLRLPVGGDGRDGE